MRCARIPGNHLKLRIGFFIHTDSTLYHRLPGIELFFPVGIDTITALPFRPPMALMREGTVLRQVSDIYLKALKYKPNLQTTYMRHGTIVQLLNEQPDLVAFCPENNVSKKLAYVALDPPFYYKEAVVYPLGSALSKAEKYLIHLLKDLPAIRDLDL